MALRALIALGLALGLAGWTPTASAQGRAQAGEARLLVEDSAPLDLADARAALAAGARTQPVRGSVGLLAAPHWMHMPVRLEADAPEVWHWRLGMSWLDRVEVYTVHGNQVQAQRLGDDLPGALHVVPGMGLVLPVTLQPGDNELWLRVETPDPLLLTPQLYSTAELAGARELTSYGYGALYGYIGALAIFFALLWLSLGLQGNSAYSVYLLSFIAVNVGYTGHGWYALWPQAVGLQHYVNLGLMTTFGAMGLVFGVRYLDLRKRHPRLTRMLLGFAGLGVASVPLCAAAGWREAAVLAAFVFTLVAAALPLLLGSLVVVEERGRDVSANYYLAAILWGLGGAGITTMTTWGLLPFTAAGFHALEFGIAIEATLLALGLAQQIRQIERRRAQSHHEARIDRLTGLPNRLAFEERARAAWRSAVRHQRPLAAVVLDVDHFKRLNDQLGHLAGDAALRWLAQQILRCCRASDIPVRWGGDEFVILLPELDATQAQGLAERLRRLALAGAPEAGGALAISLGVAERRPDTPSLDVLLDEADQALLAAKRAGRNQIGVA